MKKINNLQQRRDKARHFKQGLLGLCLWVWTRLSKGPRINTGCSFPCSFPPAWDDTSLIDVACALCWILQEFCGHSSTPLGQALMWIGAVPMIK